MIPAIINVTNEGRATYTKYKESIQICIADIQIANVVEGTMFGSVATTAMSPKHFLDHLLTLFRSSLAMSTLLYWSFYILQQIYAYLQSGI